MGYDDGDYDATTRALARAVKAHARQHYHDGGWDVIAECWDLDDIARTLADKDPVPTTTETAIDSFQGAVSAWRNRQNDARRAVNLPERTAT